MELMQFLEEVNTVDEKQVLEQLQEESDPLKSDFLRALFNYKVGMSQREVVSRDAFIR